MRAAAYLYIDGLRPPDLTWAEVERGVQHTPRQRSTVLGKAMHATLETWYLGGEPDWESLPGQVALSGAYLLPHPDGGGQFMVEDPIGDEPIELPPDAREDSPTVGLRVAGVLWAGFKDLLTYSPGDYRRLFAKRGDVFLTDYKSSANIQRYALTSPELERDLQANLYAYDVCKKLDLPSIDVHWVYFETKKVRRAAATDVKIYKSNALEIISENAQIAKQFDTYEHTEQAPANTSACGDYGGCPYHRSNGGPCTARATILSLFKREKDPEIMAINKDTKSKFEALKKKGAAPAPALKKGKPKPAPETEEEEIEDETEEEEIEDETEEEEIEPPKKGLKTKTKGADIGKLARELAEAEARVAELKTQLRAALA